MEAGGFRCTCGPNVASSTGDGLTRAIQNWGLIPQMCDPTCSFKVCTAGGTTGQFRCGFCCLWTVPAGVTCAQFQLWGHGGGTSSNCCCGGSPFGPSGAYASVIMNVTAGATYTICAGCAYCCYATQTTPGLSTQPTFVTGTGLTNFCAQAGCPDICLWRNDTLGGASAPCCRIPVNAAGPSSCGGWNFCWDEAGDGGFVEYAFAKCTSFFGSSASGTVYGINGMWPRMCVGSTLPSSFTQAAPIFGFTGSSTCCVTWGASSTCHGCCFSFQYGQGFLGIPGQGGWPSQSFGGCSAYQGDSGRMGMVCVRMK
jgi:hypothetical protein